MADNSHNLTNGRIEPGRDVSLQIEVNGQRTLIEHQRAEVNGEEVPPPDGPDSNANRGAHTEGATNIEANTNNIVNGNADRNTNGNTNGNTGAASEPPVDANGEPKKPKKSSTFKKPLRTLTLIKKGPPGGLDNTPLPDAPQGYTVRFIFHYAVNLPPADVWGVSADPFLTATLKGTNPKRHKADPDLVHRTRTLRNTISPKWDDAWVVSNVPPTGFTLKCRMYDEDYPDHNDRLGNVTLKVPHIYDGWRGIPPPGKEFDAKKRMISKHALLLKGVSSVVTHNFHMTPRLCISMEILGRSDPPYAQMCTLGPTTWIKHFSPMIGRLTGTKVNRNEEDDANSTHQPDTHQERRTQKYDFQANEMQLQGPVPPRLYHRFVEFKPIISSMFMSKGLRGKILHAALRKQHERVYNFDKSTLWGDFEPCSEEASLQFLRMAHFDEGGRIFTYVLDLDGLLRFTETGNEFGIDLLSKHTMHSDVQTYIACSGEFFIRRLQHPDSSEKAEPHEKTHPGQHIPGGPPNKPPPQNPHYYQLIIDNDSGTYRPDKRILPDLKEFLENNFPGLGIVTMDCGDEKLKEMKEAQTRIKKQEGRVLNAVMNLSQSSISSAESALDHRDKTWESGQKSKREVAYAAVEDPSTIKDAFKRFVPGMEEGESSKAPTRNEQ